jgi:hypothetical protein
MKYANSGATKFRELHQLRKENSKLMRLVADPTLDRHILPEIVPKGSQASTQDVAGCVGAKRLRDEPQPGVLAATDLSAPYGYQSTGPRDFITTLLAQHVHRLASHPLILRAIQISSRFDIFV